MNFVRCANESELTERLAQIERRLEIVEGIFKTAIGFDPNLSEDTEMLRGLIAEYPGMSQSGIARIARQRFEMSRSRAIEVLRCGVGKIWRVEFGLCNALMYFPLANRERSESEQSSASMIACKANHV
jgi:hypothetical protein